MRKIVSIMLVVVILISVCACGQVNNNGNNANANNTSNNVAENSTSNNTENISNNIAENNSITVTDASGRQVELKGTAKTCVVINRYNLELLRACGLINTVVGADNSIIQNSIYWPEFSEKNDIGAQNNVNFEKIAELQPDVVITAFYSEDLENSLKAFDIPVVTLIGYATDLNSQIDIIDAVFGQPEKSANIRKFFNDLFNTVTNVAKAIPEDSRKTAVWESIADYSIANGKNAWGEMIETAGGKNVFGDASFESSNVDAEAFITADPDYIFKMVAASGMDLSGYTAPSEDDYTAVKDAYLSRTGFGEITAIKNGDLYFVTSFSMGGMGKLLGSAYIAQWLYPQEAKAAGLDADNVFRTWLEDFQNIAFSPNQSYRVGDHIE